MKNKSIFSAIVIASLGLILSACSTTKSATDKNANATSQNSVKEAYIKKHTKGSKYSDEYWATKLYATLKQYPATIDVDYSRDADGKVEMYDKEKDIGSTVYAAHPLGMTEKSLKQYFKLHHISSAYGLEYFRDEDSTLQAIDGSNTIRPSNVGNDDTSMGPDSFDDIDMTEYSDKKIHIDPKDVELGSNVNDIPIVMFDKVTFTAKDKNGKSVKKVVKNPKISTLEYYQSYSEKHGVPLPSQRRPSN